MSNKEIYEKKTEELLEPLVAEHNLELVDVEYVKEGSSWYLRAFIDKEGGISIDECEVVSRALSELLDQHDFIPDSYILEVGSPGLGRQLKKDKDFRRSIGEEVEVKLYKGIPTIRKNKTVAVKEFTGILQGFDENSVYIELEEGTSMELVRNEIAMIRLTIDF
ncbi:ribosome maturation factor RimP [Anaeromicropila populeti]|uniref:Ribosome maturation factor RimP n=1 Tax=Anaeromicropila populeti TaxID=37658 RepID=A0A1I6JS09_9FIRM|nr:ribosome maturation factor RimP [Anaeromicropila populeti]SFR81701.1 ribosome maturation factor RimP [Anaeromicropila populeti]